MVQEDLLVMLPPTEQLLDLQWSVMSTEERCSPELCKLGLSLVHGSSFRFLFELNSRVNHLLPGLGLQLLFGFCRVVFR